MEIKQSERLSSEEADDKPVSKTASTTTNTVLLLVSGLLSLLLVGVIAFFVVTQLGQKPDPAPDLAAYSPALNAYSAANLVASDNSNTAAYKQAWRVYATSDSLDKIRSFYQDQFLALGYNQATDLTTFPLQFYKETGSRCYQVRYGLDVTSLDENKLDLPGIESEDLKKRYPNQTLFVVQQLDVALHQPGC